MLNACCGCLSIYQSRLVIALYCFSWNYSDTTQNIVACFTNCHCLCSRPNRSVNIIVYCFQLDSIVTQQLHVAEEIFCWYWKGVALELDAADIGYPFFANTCTLVVCIRKQRSELFELFGDLGQAIVKHCFFRNHTKRTKAWLPKNAAVFWFVIQSMSSPVRTLFSGFVRFVNGHR